MTTAKTCFDLLIRNGRLRNHETKLFDIGIRQGRIEAIEGTLDPTGSEVLDARGNLVTESFVNPHLHLDKVYTLPMVQESAMRSYHGKGMGQAMSAIEAAARVKESYDESWIIENVRRAIVEAARYGNTHIRAFADVDSRAKLEGVKALLRAKAEFEGVVSLQVVAFPQDGVLREPGVVNLLREAMDLGVDVVGGIPWIEYTDADAKAHVQQMFELATAYDRPVSMLVDDAGDPGLRTLEMMAVMTLEKGWQGRVLAHHARAMALYPEPYFVKLVGLLQKANLGLVSDPHTGPLHARVRDLDEAGVLVCLGQDDISDAYYPFGCNNMLEVAFLASHLLWMTTASDMDKLYDMITIKAAAAMGLLDFGLRVGGDAHLVILDSSSVPEALRYHRPPVYVLSHGKIVNAENLPA